MEKTYQPQLFEKKLYEFWSKGGYFGAKPNPEKEPFTIVMPPPNITGQLHMGHALDETVQDIIIRFKRMSGYEALWIPGTDHASIATEVKIVDKLKAEGLDKREIGREEFLRRAWEWKKQYGCRIVEQLKTLGSSCDWSREAFTMDENLSAAVLEVFCKLYDKGLIYRGDRIINWCPTCGTALSDAEVEYSEKDSFLWHFRYPLKDGSGYIEVATTRPETIPGDTAVAVNPKDPKYKHLVGKILVLPVNGREIPIVADNYVEMGFGSGAVKITPAHDPNDFEVGLRHNLPVIRVMDDNGVMNELAGKYNGLTRDECRKQIVEDLKEGGFLVKIEPYKHNVGECYRCSTIVEPIVSKQWFVKMKPLAEPAIAAVKKRKVEFIPKRFEKTYFNWMENVRDWCISRQLWWGHRIPAYYCDDCGEMTVSKTKVEVCPKCGGKHVRQDEDVLDTWFSSALWPFSTLGYPKKTKDLEYFYPTNVLVTAYDIIFFWVARMIFSGIENMGEVPFSEVLIHGLVRDSQGRKMSKSLGNGIDPLEIIDKYGADTLRFSLATGIAPGSDTRYSEEKVESCRNFMNKLWNASRFLIMNMEGKELKDISELKKLPVDKWILTKLQGLIKEVTINLNKYEIGLAAGKIYDFVWSDFCDWYIEMEKPLLYGDNEKLKIHALSMLSYVLETVLKLLHPFVPFVTEEIFQILHPDKALIVEEWPKYNKRLTYYAEAKAFEGVMNLIKAVRNIRAEMNVAPSKRVTLLIKDNEHRPFFEKTAMFIEKLAGASHVEFVKEKPTDVKVSTAVSDSVEVYIPLGELVDTEKEIARLTKELENTEKEILRAEGMLGNQKFVANAPKALVEKERDKLEKYRQKRDKLSEQIENLK
ncbi:valine--tRNA ligase [Faecalibacterium sp. CAG:1138]|nr:valine--tRNA ligase [Faecalibacterium sp. CAG:1138]